MDEVVIKDRIARSGSIKEFSSIKKNKFRNTISVMSKSQSTSVKRMDTGTEVKDQLCSLFGGQVKPKLATKQPNVRKAKDEALAWIRD